MFEKKESYKHLYAKKVLADWFREQEKEWNDPCRVAQFQWRPNYGIFEELPFYSTDDKYYFELSEGLIQNEDGSVQPIFDPNIDRGFLLFVPDVVVFHKGTPKYFFEVVHKNSVSPEKIRAIESFFSGYKKQYEDVVF